MGTHLNVRLYLNNSSIRQQKIFSVSRQILRFLQVLKRILQKRRKVKTFQWRGVILELFKIVILFKRISFCSTLYSINGQLLCREKPKICFLLSLCVRAAQLYICCLQMYSACTQFQQSNLKIIYLAPSCAERVREALISSRA